MVAAARLVPFRASAATKATVAQVPAFMMASHEDIVVVVVVVVVLTCRVLDRVNAIRAVCDCR